MKRQFIGELGEIEAARYFRYHGYLILEANYECKFGEIDLIVEDKKHICFVEVKTRSENSRYAPKDAVDFQKRAKIIASARLFLSTYDMERQPRFDIVEVFFENDEPSKLNHIENAFDATGK